MKTQTDYDISKIKYHPAYYWNMLLLYLAKKEIISIDIVNKLKWTIK